MTDLVLKHVSRMIQINYVLKIFIFLLLIYRGPKKHIC